MDGAPRDVECGRVGVFGFGIGSAGCTDVCGVAAGQIDLLLEVGDGQACLSNAWAMRSAAPGSIRIGVSFGMEVSLDGLSFLSDAADVDRVPRVLEVPRRYDDRWNREIRGETSRV